MDTRELLRRHVRDSAPSLAIQRSVQRQLPTLLSAPKRVLESDSESEEEPSECEEQEEEDDVNAYVMYLQELLGEDRYKEFDEFVAARGFVEEDEEVYLDLTFKHVIGVFSPATLARVLAEYRVAEAEVNRELSFVDGNVLALAPKRGATFVPRQGRVDVALFRPSQHVVDDAIGRLDETPQARLMGGVRTLIAPRAVKAQPWHQDRTTVEQETRYLTLAVALEDTTADGATEFLLPAGALPLEEDETTGLLVGTIDPSRDEDVLPSDGTLDGEYDAARIGVAVERAAKGTGPLLAGVKVILRANEGLLFDGRLWHRGSASSGRRGGVVYIVFTDPRLEENL